MLFLPERTFLNMVMTLDGKITTRDGSGPKFASQADQERMMQLRSEADAIIIGARTAIDDNPTFDLPEKYRRSRKNGLASNPIKAVISGRGSIPSTLKMFTSNDSQAVVFTTDQINSGQYNSLHKVADVHVVGKLEVDFTQIAKILVKEYNVKQLLIEGGGQVNFAAFQADIVDEVFLTLSPKIAGGNIQTIVEGTGFDFNNLIELELLNHQKVSSEIFLHYRVVKNR